MLFGLNLIKQEKFVASFLKEHRIQVIEDEANNSQLSKKIKIKNAEYNLAFYPGKSKILSYHLQRIINNTVNNRLAGAIIITDKPLSDTSKKLLKSNKNIKVIYATTEEKLGLKLEKYFFEK